MEKVKFKTEDGFEIYGNYEASDIKDAPAVLLLHMMPATKESWTDFQAKLAQEGFQSLAIDLRGHGESVTQNGEDVYYQNFTDKEHQEKINDIEAAVEFLSEKGVQKSSLALAGASIGANLACWYLADENEVKTAILISPGLDYRGIKLQEKLAGLDEGQSVLLACGGDKDEYSQKTVNDVFDDIKVKKEKFIFDDAEHGTKIFMTHPEFMDEIINWLKETYK